MWNRLKVFLLDYRQRLRISLAKIGKNRYKPGNTLFAKVVQVVRSIRFQPIMKNKLSVHLFTTCTGMFLCLQAQARYQPALWPDPITVWTPYADTGFAAPLKFGGGGVVSSFTGFVAPVITGFNPSFGMGPPTTGSLAFKATMATGTVTTANNEGIWSNVYAGMGSSPGSAIWMVAQESDVVGVRTLGNGGKMKVRALQTTHSVYGTLFNTNSNIDPSANFSVHQGVNASPLAGPTAPFTSGGLAVEGAGRIAVWAKNGSGFDGTLAWDVDPVSPHAPIPAPPATMHWTSPSSNPRVQCSPAISFYGAVAHRARSIPSLGFPPDKRDYIEVVPMNPVGLFPAKAMVVRAGDAAPSTGEFFGTFHPVLMATTGGPNVAPTVAWQMSTMLAGENSGSTLGSSIPFGTPIPNSGSLWCWRKRPTVPSYAQIARAGQSATDITGRTFKSFYALHLVDDDDILNYPDTDVFYGVILDNDKHAIYTRQISTDAFGNTILSVEQLIATDSPGAPPTLRNVPVIYGPPGTSYPIATLYPWFSVDIFGNLMMKATLGGAVPTAERQCLLTSKRGTEDHALRMRAQSSATASLPTLSHGMQNITNFTINAHEQGPMGRGQGIYEQTIGALVTFPGGSGVYTGY